MKSPIKETLNKKLRQEIRDKANQASELSQVVYESKLLNEVNRFGKLKVL